MKFEKINSKLNFDNLNYFIKLMSVFINNKLKVLD